MPLLFSLRHYAISPADFFLSAHFISFRFGFLRYASFRRHFRFHFIFDAITLAVDSF
jgi:hypothetical protein